LNPAIATTAFVLDNSVLCGWFLANQATPYSDAVAGLLPVVDAHAPPGCCSWSSPICCAPMRQAAAKMHMRISAFEFHGFG